MQIRVALNTRCKVRDHYLSVGFDIVDWCYFRTDLRRLKCHYKELIKFERVCVIWLGKGGIFPHEIAQSLGRYLATMHHCWQQWWREGAISWSQVSGHLRGTIEKKIVVFAIWLWGIVLHLHQKFELNWHHNNSSNYLQVT